MHFRMRNLMFLLGMSPLCVGCSGGKGDDEDDGTDTGETGSTSASGDGSTIGSTDEGDSTTDDGDSTTGDLCGDYAATYADCYDPYYAQYVLEWCEYAHGIYQQYGSPACLSAWEATMECRSQADCFLAYYACEAVFLAQIQACYYDDGLYNGCDLMGHLVTECVSPTSGQKAEDECDQLYDELYFAHGSGCGDAFLEMMVCISQLECLALSDKDYVWAHCGDEIHAKNFACQ